eukprot:9857031-Alexandrium_andersonii.AAC.1
MGSPAVVSSRSSPQLRRSRGFFGKFARLRAAGFYAALHSLAVGSLAACGRRSGSSSAACSASKSNG